MRSTDFIPLNHHAPEIQSTRNGELPHSLLRTARLTGLPQFDRFDRQGKRKEPLCPLYFGVQVPGNELLPTHHMGMILPTNPLLGNDLYSWGCVIFLPHTSETLAWHCLRSEAKATERTLRVAFRHLAPRWCFGGLGRGQWMSSSLVSK